MKSLIRHIWQVLYFAWARITGRRTVLLSCANSLMSEYLADFRDIFRDDPRLSFRALIGNWDNDSTESRRRLGVPEVSRAWARRRPWDLVVTASHEGFEDITDRRRNACVFINHGIASGKLVNGEPYAYGKGALTAEGKPRYDRMLLPSQAVCRAAIELHPVLEPVVAATGFLQCDRVLEKSAERQPIRARLGLDPSDKAVFILSTWGPENLYHCYGDALLTEAKKLLGEYKFILNVHPNEFRPRTDGGRVWGEYLRSLQSHGFLFREPDADWMEYMAAADVVISDHTSLCLYAPLLALPVVFAPFKRDVLAPASLVLRLRDMSEELQPDMSDLSSKLAAAIAQNDPAKQRAFTENVTSWPGQTAERIRQEVYAALRLQGV
jgi:hypothetical protein